MDIPTIDEAEEQGEPAPKQSFMEDLHAAAEAGNLNAQCELGMRCLKSGSNEAALKWFGRAAQGGSPDGQLELGKLLASGIIEPANPQNAFDWLVVAFAGRPTAASVEIMKLWRANPEFKLPGFVLNTLLFHLERATEPEGRRMCAFAKWAGLGGIDERGAAFTILERLIEEGDAEAMYLLYHFQEAGDEDEEDEEESEHLEEAEAELEEGDEHPGEVEDSQASEVVDEEAEEFKGTTGLEEVANLHLLKAAAKAGVPAAMLDYGLLLLDQNEPGFKELISEAAQAGLPDAQFLWATLVDGEGQAQLAECLHWLGKSARSGYVAAKQSIAQKFNDLIPEQFSMSEERWLELFANAGLPDALFELGQIRYCNAFSKGAVVDAVSLFARAAFAGHDRALERLATCFLLGDGVPKDPEFAKVLRVDRGKALLQLLPAFPHVPCEVSPPAPPAVVDEAAGQPESVEEAPQ